MLSFALYIGQMLHIEEKRNYLWPMELDVEGCQQKDFRHFTYFMKLKIHVFILYGIWCTWFKKFKHETYCMWKSN